MHVEERRRQSYTALTAHHSQSDGHTVQQMWKIKLVFVNMSKLAKSNPHLSHLIH